MKVRVYYQDYKKNRSTSKTIKGTKEEVESIIQNFYKDRFIGIIKVCYL